MPPHSLPGAPPLRTPDRSARWRSPFLRGLIALGIAVKGHFKIAERDDEAGPTVNEAGLDEVVLHEGPDRVPKRARHRDALVRELRRSKRRIAVHLGDDLLQIAVRELPDGVTKRAERLVA